MRRLVAIGAAILVGAAGSQGQAQGSPAGISRATLRNDVGIELLGRALLYSFSYQRMLSAPVGLDVGLGVLGGSSSGDNTSIIFVPVGVRLYLIPKDGSLFLTGGGVLVTGSVDSGPFSDSATDTYGYAGLGFEYRSVGGFLFRTTAYGLFAGGDYFIWPGLSIGYAF
jgi:hypothetical protein